MPLCLPTSLRTNKRTNERKKQKKVSVANTKKSREITRGSPSDSDHRKYKGLVTTVSTLSDPGVAPEIGYLPFCVPAISSCVCHQRNFSLVSRQLTKAIEQLSRTVGRSGRLERQATHSIAARPAEIKTSNGLPAGEKNGSTYPHGWLPVILTKINNK